MLTTTKKTTVPGTIKAKLEFVRELTYRNRVTHIIYMGSDEENDRNIRVHFEAALFEDDDYPDFIEATFTALPNKPEEEENESNV